MTPSKSNEELLRDIDKKVDSLIQSMESLQEEVVKHDHIIFGNDRDGLLTEVDRLKEHRKNTEKTAIVVWSTGIGLVIKTIWDAIIK